MKVQLRTYNYRFPKIDLWLDGTATFNAQGNMTVTNATGNVLADNLTPAMVKRLETSREPMFRVKSEEMTMQEMYEKLFEKG